ncbi:MAG: helix-turn-helix domain-containing protein [Velocimicrobium sp.]
MQGEPNLYLQHSNSSITNIALNCGFSNASQFSTIFKEMYHISLKNYRNSKQNEL